MFVRYFLPLQDVRARAAQLPGLGKRRRGQPTDAASLKSSRADASSRPREPELYDDAASSSEASAMGQSTHGTEAAEALGMPTASGASLEAHAPAESAGASTSHNQPQVC